MKRDLDEFEKELTVKGIQSQKKQIKEAEETAEYNKKYIEFIKAKWLWEDYSVPINREKTMKEFERAVKEAETIQKSGKQIIDELRRQLKEGVEIKENSLIK